MTNPKIRENRLRRAAARQRLYLVKSARRDPRAVDYNRWWVIDERTDEPVLGDEDGVTLDEVEQYLTGEVR